MLIPPVSVAAIQPLLEYCKYVLSHPRHLELYFQIRRDVRRRPLEDKRCSENAAVGLVRLLGATASDQSPFTLPANNCFSCFATTGEIVSPRLFATDRLPRSRRRNKLLRLNATRRTRIEYDESH